MPGIASSLFRTFCILPLWQALYFVPYPFIPSSHAAVPHVSLFIVYLNNQTIWSTILLSSKKLCSLVTGASNW